MLLLHPQLALYRAAVKLQWDSLVRRQSWVQDAPHRMGSSSSMPSYQDPSQHRPSLGQLGPAGGSAGGVDTYDPPPPQSSGHMYQPHQGHVQVQTATDASGADPVATCHCCPLQPPWAETKCQLSLLHHLQQAAGQPVRKAIGSMGQCWSTTSATCLVPIGCRTVIGTAAIKKAVPGSWRTTPRIHCRHRGDPPSAPVTPHPISAVPCRLFASMPASCCRTAGQ